VSELSWRIVFYCPVPMCEWRSEPMHPQATTREGEQYERHYLATHVPRPGIEQIMPEPIIR
jgi:hypothetical protein